MNNNIFNILGELNISDSDDSENESVNDWIIPPKKISSTGDISQNNYTSYVEIENYMTKKKNKLRKEKHKHKNMLCKNIISKHTCHYGNKCLYAHSLTEQKISDVRKKAFQLVGGELDAAVINIYVERDLYKTLLSMCDMCEKCAEGKCTGGYNCREGVCDKKYLVCRADLNSGTCDTENCTKIHLTKMGLKPYFKYIIDQQAEKQVYYGGESVGTLLTADFFKKMKILNSKENAQNCPRYFDIDYDTELDAPDNYIYDFESSIFEIF